MWFTTIIWILNLDKSANHFHLFGHYLLPTAVFPKRMQFSMELSKCTLEAEQMMGFKLLGHELLLLVARLYIPFKYEPIRLCPSDWHLLGSHAVSRLHGASRKPSLSGYSLWQRILSLTDRRSILKPLCSVRCGCCKEEQLGKFAKGGNNWS